MKISHNKKEQPNIAISKYKKLLQTAGMEIVEKQRLSEETRLKLERPFVPDEQYIAASNERFDVLLAKI